MNIQHSLIRFLCLFPFGFVGFVALGDPAASPEPPLPPKEVVLRQLEALQTNGAEDEGIRVAWEYAHPRNRAQTGPFPRFAAMLKGSTYAPLLNHRRHSVKVLEANQDAAAYTVTLVSGEGVTMKFLWVLQPVNPDNPPSPWATVMVSAPRVIEII